QPRPDRGGVPRRAGHADRPRATGRAIRRRALRNAAAGAHRRVDGPGPVGPARGGGRGRRGELSAADGPAAVGGAQGGLTGGGRRCGVGSGHHTCGGQAMNDDPVFSQFRSSFRHWMTGVGPFWVVYGGVQVILPLFAGGRSGWANPAVLAAAVLGVGLLVCGAFSIAGVRASAYLGTGCAALVCLLALFVTLAALDRIRS